jgi:hypothetical protein
MKTERVHTPLVFEPVTSDMSNATVIFAMFDPE